MFTIEMLPAAHGDAILLTYGAPPGRLHRILIDGGIRWTYRHLRSRILELHPDDRHFELLVVTHVDADHIEGVIRLLQDETVGVTFGEVWFNGQPQLDSLPDPASDDLGPTQGEFLGALIRSMEADRGQPLWNTRFGGAPVMIPTDPEASLQSETFAGLTLTVVSPGLDQLLALKDEWQNVLAEADFTSGDTDAALAALRGRPELAPPDELGTVAEADEEPDPEDAIDLPGELGGSDAEFGSDTTPANGSSIAVIAEFDGHRALLSGDAHPEPLIAGLRRWMAEQNENKVEVDAFKVAHHGSVANVSEELLGLVRAKRYLVSTSGAIFGHPHDRAIELLLRTHGARGKPTLVFNHRTSHTGAWADPDDQTDRGYNAVYPAGCRTELG